MLALAIIGSNIDVAAESNLMGVYIDPTDVDPADVDPIVMDDLEKRFDFHGVKGKRHNNRHRPGKLRNKHKHTKSSYGVPPISQYEPAKPYRPAHNKPKGKYPPKTQYSSGPVKTYVAPTYNSPAYSLPLHVHSSTAYKSPVLRPQSSNHPIHPSPQALVAHRPPSRPTTPRYKNSPSVRPKTSPPTRPKTSPPTRPKTSPPTRPKNSPPTHPKTSHRPSSSRPPHYTTSPTATTSASTTTIAQVYSSPAPVSTTTSTTTTTTPKPLDTSTTSYNSSVSVSSTSSPPDSSSLKTESSQSKKKYAPPKKEIIPLKLKNEVPIKPVPYTPKITPKANSTTSVSVVKDKDINEGFFSSPVQGFPNFFKQLLQQG